MKNYNLTQLKALVVDDYAPIRHILRDILKEFGIRNVSEAANGYEALNEIAGEPPDVIFTDYMMEEMNGLELVEIIRRGETEADRFVPIVVVSAYTEIKDILRARDMGATDFLAKPISGKMVFDRLRGIIEHPREFVESERFFGPDRRRRDMPTADDERRKQPYQYKSARRSA